MGVVIVKSNQITNRDATPKVMNSPAINSGMCREVVATVETANGDSIGSTYLFFTVPSNARVSQLLLYCDDIGTTTVADFGLYDTTENGGALVDATHFASAVVLNAGALNGTDITHEAGSAKFDISKGEQMIWQVLALAADPCKHYDVVATLTAASDAAGTITLKMRYVR